VEHFAQKMLAVNMLARQSEFMGLQYFFHLLEFVALKRKNLFDNS
jgi:hypothetical protein